MRVATTVDNIWAKRIIDLGGNNCPFLLPPRGVYALCYHVSRRPNVLRSRFQTFSPFVGTVCRFHKNVLPLVASQGRRQTIVLPGYSVPGGAMQR